MAATNKRVLQGMERMGTSAQEQSTCRGVVEVLARVGDKWTVMVVATLAGGVKRYSEIRREVGHISQRMLTLTLKGLEHDGLVTRTMYPTVPPRVDYELTAMGRSLFCALQPLHAWAEVHKYELLAARERYAHARGVAAADQQVAAGAGEAASLSMH